MSKVLRSIAAGIDRPTSDLSLMGYSSVTSVIATDDSQLHTYLMDKHKTVFYLMLTQCYFPTGSIHTSVHLLLSVTTAETHNTTSSTCPYSLHWFLVATDRIVGVSPRADQGLKSNDAN